LQFKDKTREVSIESVHGLHELDIYLMLEKLFPHWIKVNTNDETVQEGYSYTFKGSLYSVLIFRAD
jgi:hypothetical protein